VNFLDSLQQLVVHASVPSVACSFFLEQSAAPTPQFLEEVLFGGDAVGVPSSVKFHSIAVSPHIKVFDFLQAVGLELLDDRTTHWKVFVHLVCRYDSSTQCVPATIAVQLDLAGLRKLPHLVSSLITAGIGEAHPK
jgi:hypothetical protein